METSDMVGNLLRHRARLLGRVFVACVIPGTFLLAAGVAPKVVLTLVFLGSALVPWIVSSEMVVKTTESRSKAPGEITAVPAKSDDELFKDLYDSQWRSVYAFFSRQRGGLDPEDLTQEVFLIFYEKRHLYRDSPMKYLARVTRDVAINESRRASTVHKAERERFSKALDEARVPSDIENLWATFLLLLRDRKGQ